MLINFENAVHPVDKYSQRAFVEILNLILLSGNATELNCQLRRQNCNPDYRSLSGYYKWSFDNYIFSLWQRVEYESKECFPDKVLEVRQISLECQDKWRNKKIDN